MIYNKGNKPEVLQLKFLSDLQGKGHGEWITVIWITVFPLWGSWVVKYFDGWMDGWMMTRVWVMVLTHVVWPGMPKILQSAVCVNIVVAVLGTRHIYLIFMNLSPSGKLDYINYVVSLLFSARRPYIVYGVWKTFYCGIFYFSCFPCLSTLHSAVI